MLFNPSIIAQRKQKTALALESLLGPEDLVLVMAGEPITKPGGLDQTYPFLPHPDYFWLTGSRRPFGISAFTRKEGWIDFVLPVTKEEKIWEGGATVIPGQPLSEFDPWLRSMKPAKIYVFGQNQARKELSQISEEALLPVQEAFHEVRRAKDMAEIELIKSIALMASHGYNRIKNFIRPGVSERDIQIEYETEVLKRGSEKMPYESIVGTGTNAAILHAIPTSRIVKDGEMVLIDAGADVQDYCVDITRVYPANGKFTSQQKSIYDLVKKAQEASIALCRPGTEWKDVHLASAKVMAQGLFDLGILRSSVQESLDTGAIATFFPHGVGHMVGLKVRDVGGRPNPNPKKYAGARIRVDMPLKENYLMTVQPGLYFIEALLNDDETRTQFKNQINWSEIEKWKTVGGVRLEDDIFITKEGPLNLTAMIDK